MKQTSTSTPRSPRVTVIDPRVPKKAKLRVAAYARVSSDSDNQVNSYIAQVDHYTKYIASHEDWEMADIYADESIILGTSREVLAMQGFPGLILIFIWPEICGPPGRMITKCAKSSR